jgi:hypothetical protein
MHPTRAWLFAFRRAFRVSYDAPPPSNKDEFLSLLRLADQRRAEVGGDVEDDMDESTQSPPARH